MLLEAFQGKVCAESTLLGGIKEEKMWKFEWACGVFLFIYEVNMNKRSSRHGWTIYLLTLPKQWPRAQA